MYCQVRRSQQPHLLSVGEAFKEKWVLKQRTAARPPRSVDEMTNTMSKHLVEDLLKVKAKEGNDASERMYKEVSRCYVVANRYEKKGHMHWHAH